jgi:hypothetical protein
VARQLNKRWNIVFEMIISETNQMVTAWKLVIYWHGFSILFQQLGVEPTVAPRSGSKWQHWSFLFRSACKFWCVFQGSMTFTSLSYYFFFFSEKMEGVELEFGMGWNHGTHILNSSCNHFLSFSLTRRETNNKMENFSIWNWQSKHIFETFLQ